MAAQKTVLVISLNFNPGHVSHMIASYKQCKELGYKPFYYVSQPFVDFLPKDSQSLVYGLDSVENCDLAVFLFPAKTNLRVIYDLKHRFGSKIVYIFHEPLAPMKVYRKAGFSYKYLARLWVINKISALTVKWSNLVLLPSKKAIEFYEANSQYKNKNYHYIPLLFDDERTSLLAKKQREYFSYIGTVAADHSFKEYLRFVEWAVIENRIPKLKFLIATKSEFEVPQALVESSRVRIQKGKPLSDAEINECYASTYVVWNAYARTTQSGVLAKSFMFGTPAIVLRKNLSEFSDDGKEVVAIDNNTYYDEVEAAISSIINDFEHYSNCARNRFEEVFFYKKYNEELNQLLSSIWME